MIDSLNIALAALSILFGLIGWLAPRFAMEKLDLHRGATTMGVSEIRAASGALFVGLGAGALVLASPTAFLMVGCAWGGAAIGRITSILVDEAPTRTTWIFFITEVVVAALLIGLNL